jgi:hypothetical protein
MNINKKSKKAQGMKSKISPASLVLKKQAQMKIQQMAFMLIAVFLFFALAGMIIITIKFSGLKQTATDLAEKNAALLVTKLANSPEFSCGASFGTKKTDCVDEDKVMALKDNINKYTGFWGISNIEIRRIYPENKNITCNLTNYPNCDIIKLIDKPTTGLGKSNFVALCRKERSQDGATTKCEIAKITVKYEEVK